MDGNQDTSNAVESQLWWTGIHRYNGYVRESFSAVLVVLTFLAIQLQYQRRIITWPSESFKETKASSFVSN
jgi:hypothetical protein